MLVDFERLIRSSSTVLVVRMCVVLPLASLLIVGAGCPSPPPTDTVDGSTSEGEGSTSEGSSGSSVGADSTGLQPGCGNGVVEDGEDCDPGTGVDEPSCNVDCTAVVCGDGHTNLAAGEECDDANAEPVDECTPECRSTLFFDDMNGPGMWTVELPTWGAPGDEFMLTSGWQQGIPEPDVWQSGVYSSSPGTTRLISPPLAFPAEAGDGYQFELRFRHRIRLDGNPTDVSDSPCPGPIKGDGGVVWLMAEDGMMQRVGPPPDHPDELDELGGCSRVGMPNNPLYDQPGPVYTGISSSDLTDVTLPLPTVGGQTMRLVFELGYDCANCWGDAAPAGVGWVIDDVVVAPFPS